MPEDTLLVERDAALGGKVGGEARTRCCPVMDPNDPRVAPLEPAEGDRKRVTQARNHLKEGQICIAARLAEQITPGCAPQYPFKIVEIFRQPD